MAANEGKILPLPPQAAMTEAPHIAVESPGEGKLRQIGFAQAVDDVVSLRGADYAETILPDQTGHAGMVLQTDGTTADWANVETVRLYAKNNSGSTLVRGQAVYVNGASGTNILITKAQANAESTSSKTIGLVETASVAPNDFCWVVTEGILAGVDTSAATADGDTVWLSPTTAGGLVYGLANKPSAPNHMVFIGYVTWKQSNNGEIYVKPQNGFELEELHNVQIISPTTGQALVYDATVTPPLWKNATISGGGGGSGDVTGPVSSTLNAVARFSDATGKVIKNSAVTVDDTGNVSGAVQVSASAGFVGPNVYATPNSTTTSAEVRIYEDYGGTGSNFVALKSPSTMSANQTWTLPSADGSSGQVFKTNASGVISVGDVSINNVTGAKFTSDITVNLSGGRTFGRYATGDVIPATNKTANEVILLAAVQATLPTASLSVSGSVPFGTTSTTLTATYSYAGTGGATITSTSLEFRRGGTGLWTVLSTGASPYTHNLTYARFLTSVINYRLVVTDSNGLSTTATYDVTPEAYSAPSVSSWNVGTTSRDLGDIARTITATITRNRTNVPITGWRLIRNANGTETTISTNTVITNPASISFSVSDSGFSTATTSLYYRLEYTDEYITSYTACTNGTSSTVSFSHRFYYGASTLTDVTTIAQIEGLTSGSLTSSRALTLTGVSATSSQYYYYCYPSSAGDLTSVIQDGAYQVLGSFQNTAPANSEPTSPKTVTGTNTFGASVSYRVYKTTAKGAFTSVTLAFS